MGTARGGDMARDLRRYSRQTQTRLALGGALLLVLVGDGLIWVFFGREAALMGLLCIGAGLSPLVSIWAALNLIEWIAKRSNKE